MTWIIASFLFSWYLCQLQRYLRFAGRRCRPNFWIWISTIVMFLDAELNPEIEHQTARDLTIGAEKPSVAP